MTPEQNQQARAFARSYGLGPTQPWPDERLDQALADHGLPRLDQLPAEPRGQAFEIFGLSPAYVPQDDEERQNWRRVNAGHLIGHVILHAGERCLGCADWGTDDD